MEVLPFVDIKHSSLEGCETEYNEFFGLEETSVIESLSKRLEGELRTAKRTHLSVGEVLLPNGLTHSIAKDLFYLADSEPCGLRGCTLYIDFEMNDIKTNLSQVKCDASTPSTFEVYLTLKQAVTGWNSLLPQFLRKITKSGAIMISVEYDLQKKQLYRSDY
ncbi:protein charybde-like [Diorhabda carinulata]|uniref:protein charybde-like n=1 Tax=Diorhabda sublineata TaxID=1163346 RepID=UPI0024E088F6|nr:protein charybde-like [Diorhabda sublineata]XP_057653172.1 protein charybde-like [Diorhabda carinulata]